MAKKPVVSHVPNKSDRSPQSGAAKERKLWTFSFRYFREIKHFGLKEQDSAWFADVLSKLGDLSKKTIADTNANPAEKVAWRLHEIDWKAKGVPYARADLDWLDKAYLENAEEFPIQQFQVTKALGRVIGFFDETQTFNIIFLDPMHNMQPSAYSDYKVRATIVTESTSASIIRFLEDQLSGCPHGECACRTAYAAIQGKSSTKADGATLLVHVPNDLFVRVTKCIEGGAANSVSEIILSAMDSLEA